MNKILAKHCWIVFVALRVVEKSWYAVQAWKLHGVRPFFAHQQQGPWHRWCCHKISSHQASCSALTPILRAQKCLVQERLGKVAVSQQGLYEFVYQGYSQEKNDNLLSNASKLEHTLYNNAGDARMYCCTVYEKQKPRPRGGCVSPPMPTPGPFPDVCGRAAGPPGGFGMRPGGFGVRPRGHPQASGKGPGVGRRWGGTSRHRQRAPGVGCGMDAWSAGIGKGERAGGGWRRDAHPRASGTAPGAGGGGDVRPRASGKDPVGWRRRGRGKGPGRAAAGRCVRRHRERARGRAAAGRASASIGKGPRGLAAVGFAQAQGQPATGWPATIRGYRAS
jgi:hypothetical protein